ncbi:hypothetical protein [Chroococcidiopsis sp. TS-821]|uniref:hypothetical protein n=1 Tax=Chroococcidiopsis sp. TS-821 TaxID=1378066 RepID=UPI000CEDD5B7|nr:hypothetical protein [Chroococcidiopsis sp. TS-821]PPS40923.1 hypothetical protein B1A85_18585 [Chroococcidiopsis sp. TS-821]
MPYKRRLARTVALSVILLPAAYIFYWIMQSGEISTDDYWNIISRFYSIDGFSSHPTDWLVRANEHLVFIPAILYAVNMMVTKGSNIGLSCITFSFACVQAILLAMLLPQNLRRSRSLFFGLLLCISFFCFTPAAAHNWMRGFSGVAWIGANLLVTASIFCLSKLVRSQNIIWAISGLFFAALGALTYSTALAVLPVLCAAVVLMRLPMRIVLLYLAAAIAIGGTYVLTYKTPEYHPPVSLNIRDLLAYIPTYLGAIFTQNTYAAFTIGAVGCAIAICCMGYWLTPQGKWVRVAWLPWLALQGYALGTALMAAMSRSGFGVISAMQSRYASLPSLFWLSLTAIAVTGLQNFRLNDKSYWQLRITLLAGLTVLILSMYRVGTEAAQMIARTASLQPLVTLSVQLGVTDADVVQQIISPAPDQFFNLTTALKQHGFVPFHQTFNNSFCIGSEQLSSPVLKPLTPTNTLPGFFDSLTKLTPNVARVEGWVGVSDRHNHLDCVAIFNQNNIIRGFALIGFPRPDVAQVFGTSYASSGWKGYVNLSPEDETLFAYTRTNQKEWIGLQQHTYKLNEHYSNN